VGNRQRIFGHVELFARGDPVAVERPLAPGLDLGELEVGRGEVAIGVRLMELRPIVAIIDAREQVAPFDVSPLFDRLLDDLAENLGADGDVFVARNDVARAG
jgi:hypothetical protein